MRTAQGALSVTAGAHTGHSSSFTPRAKGWEGEHLVGFPQGSGERTGLPRLPVGPQAATGLTCSPAAVAVVVVQSLSHV